MESLRFENEERLRAFAANFARRLKAGDVVALSGPLGSGKTTFADAIVRALHGGRGASSPTFTFWQRYDGAPPIDHLDAFRIGDAAELSELGLEAAFDDPGSIVLVEWWHNAESLLPASRYEIDISGCGDRARSVRVREPA